MVRFWNRAIFSGCAVAMLICASCKSTTGGILGDRYDRGETLKVTQLGTKRLSDKPKVEKQKRVLVHLRGSEQASYYVLTGPIKHETQAHITKPVVKTEPGRTPPVVPADPVEVRVTDDAETDNLVVNEFPFFFLYSGYAYVSGTAPAAQTEHVIAGSDSTKFIIEVDPNGTTTPATYIHRVYAVDGTVQVQAIGDGGARVGPEISLAPDFYVEVRREGGSWTMFGPAAIGNNTFVARVKNEAVQAGSP